MAFNPKLSL